MFPSKATVWTKDLHPVLLIIFTIENTESRRLINAVELILAFLVVTNTIFVWVPSTSTDITPRLHFIIPK
jgi:hypothetical protein